jgi:hypothetical protein
MFVAKNAVGAAKSTYSFPVVRCRDREVTPIEQWIRGYLSFLPLLVVLIIMVLNWPQILSMAGGGAEALQFALIWKPPDELYADCARSNDRTSDRPSLSQMAIP